MKVLDGIYVFQDKNLGQNASLIVGDEVCILVDNRQNIPLARELKEAVRAATDKPVRYVINTHYHGDHTFGNQIFREEAVDIVGHKNVRATLLEIGEQHKDFFRDYFGVSGTEEVVITPPTLTFEKGLSIRFGENTLNVVHPGSAHTETDSFIYIPEQKLLITGDLCFNGVLGFSGDPHCTLGGWVKAIEEMEKLDVETIIPGHGPVGNKGDLAVFRQYLEKVLTAVRREIDGGKTLDEMKKSVTLSEYRGWGHYDDWREGNIEAAYNELSRR